MSDKLECTYCYGSPTIEACPACGGVGWIINFEDLPYYKQLVITSNRYNDQKAQYKRFINQTENYNHYARYVLFPELLKYEKLWLEQGHITLDDIPGGPLKPNQDILKEAKQMAEEKYTAFYATVVKEEVKNETKAPEAPAPTPEPTIEFETEETTMRQTVTTGQKLRAGGGKIAAALREGAVQGTIGSVNRQAVRALEDRFGDNYPEVFKTDTGRKAIEVAIPALFSMLLEFDIDNKVPQKKYIEMACQEALKDASASAVSDVINVLLTEALPMMQAYAAAGQQIAEQEQVEDFTEKVANMQKVEEANVLFADR